MVNEQIFHIQILFQPLFLYVRGRVFCMGEEKTHSTGLFEWVKSKKNVKKVVDAKTLLCYIVYLKFLLLVF